MALVLDAPILVTGTNPQYTALEFDPESSIRSMLSSWWGIESKEDLQSTLRWLQEEGGHTVVFNIVLGELHLLTFQQKLNRIKEAELSSRDEGIRFNTAFRYQYDLGQYTTRAFDISRYVLLVKSGFNFKWLTEDETWSLIVPQAELIINHNMFSTHQEYLLSHYVGRTFVMKHEAGSIKKINDVD
jgi:hypothetical protein